MAYYAALISVLNTVKQLPRSSQISILQPSQEILTFAARELKSFIDVLEIHEESISNNSSNERLKSLNEQIREAACKLEDAFDSHVSNQSENLEGEGSSQQLILDLKELKEEINSFSQTMKKIEKMMIEELSHPLPEEDDVVSSRVDFSGKHSNMVGLSEEFSYLKDLLINGLSSRCRVISIFGMAGIGKSALAMKIFEDPLISSHFDHRVFLTIGQKYKLKKVMLSILTQMNHDIDEIRMKEIEKLKEHIRRNWQGKRYLFVLDDVWDVFKFDELSGLLPKGSNESRILVTTRSEMVALWATHHQPKCAHHMRFLTKEESWDLLCTYVFGEGYLCPLQLEKFGKKIAENCEGLPLAIITVANILSKGEKTLEYWKKVADKENSVFTDAYDQMSNVLILSYNYLPQYVKPCFLYMGVFPERCKIRASKLAKLWYADQILRGVTSADDAKDIAKDCLRKLVSKSIVIVDKLSSSSRGGLYKRVVKSCKLHPAYWHLCVKEAHKERFLYIINHYVSSFSESTKDQRRLCIHNNVLFGIKVVHKSMESISVPRSLLCTGPYLQYPVPVCFRFRLLRVLDALSIRFYKFPIEVLKLVQLRYLALTYSGKVPGSISKLWNLEYLIVHRHLSINKSARDSSYLPMEIWNMKELRHIQVQGGNLLDPCGALLPNLLTLSDISVNSCSREILKRTPCLGKLGIQIELTPDAVEPLCCFDHISHLSYLESLKCVVVNPKPSSQAVASFTTLPSCLMKLSLSGLGYPWEYMRTIAKLPRLEVLKLRCYAFQGPIWETFDDEFSSLEYLLLEDTDLVHWRGHSSCCFPKLWSLIINHCYKLKEIPSFFGSHWQHRWTQPELMELVDCPSFGASVKQLQEKYRFRKIYVRSSLDDEKVKS